MNACVISSVLVARFFLLLVLTTPLTYARNTHTPLLPVCRESIVLPSLDGSYVLSARDARIWGGVSPVEIRWERLCGQCYGCVC